MDHVAPSPRTTPGQRQLARRRADPPPASTPVRDSSRYGSPVPSGSPATCVLCAAPLLSARAQYCSAGCRQHAYRLRQATPAKPPGLAGGSLRARLRRLGALIEHTVYECPTCDQRFLGQQRCEDCNRFCRALGLGGACPECDQPLLIADLLGLEVTS